MNPLDKDDFEELLVNCADEPIRTPGAIQPHGVLLTLSEPELCVLQISANVERLLGRTPQEVVSLPLHLLLGDHYALQVEAAAQQNNMLDVDALHMTLNGEVFEGFVHRHQGVLVLELETRGQAVEHRPWDGKASNLGRMLQRVQAAKTLQALYEISVQEIQAITGYDRVLIYRFEEEGHGQVIAEATSPSMEVFQGLFFPASEQARELYRTNWLRTSRMPTTSRCRWCLSCAPIPGSR